MPDILLEGFTGFEDTGTAGVTDHGGLTGLSDDDHSQYLLLAGRGGQEVTDDLTVSGNFTITDGMTMTGGGSIVSEGPSISILPGGVNGLLIDSSGDGLITGTFAFDAGGTLGSTGNGNITIEPNGSGQIVLAKAVGCSSTVELSGLTRAKSTFRLEQGGLNGGLDYKTTYANVDVTADTSISLGITIPSGCLLVGSQLRLVGEMASGDEWDAEFNDGSTVDSIVSGAATTDETKVNKFATTGTVTDDDTDIVFTRNAGGSFTASGVFWGVAYYKEFNDL